MNPNEPFESVEMNETRKHIAMTAAMDQRREAARNIGEKETVSELELFALSNFARIGLLYTFLKLGGDVSDKLRAEIREIMLAIDEQFPQEGSKCDPLTECCAAMLGGERFGKYVLSRGGK